MKRQIDVQNFQYLEWFFFIQKKRTRIQIKQIVLNLSKLIKNQPATVANRRKLFRFEFINFYVCVSACVFLVERAQNHCNSTALISTSIEFRVLQFSGTTFANDIATFQLFNPAQDVLDTSTNRCSKLFHVNQ